MHKSGRFSDAPSKAFSRHLRKIGVKRPRLSFHSLRHTFSAALKRLSAEWEARQRLLGHAVAGVAGRYGDSYEAEAFDMQLLHMRAELIERLEF
jgi:integrase